MTNSIGPGQSAGNTPQYQPDDPSRAVELNRLRQRRDGALQRREGLRHETGAATGAQQSVSELRGLFESVNQGEVNRQAAPRENQQRNTGQSVQMFSNVKKTKLQYTANADHKVYIAGFSSQGGGHTARMLEPLGLAAESGDTIVLALPPHWESDRGNEQDKLTHFTNQYREAGINVMTVQSDKAIWGFYKPDGPSDNFRILEEFAYKPQRDEDDIPLFGGEARGHGFKHTEIVQQVVDAVGQDKMGQIRVFEDMDPYLGKAATGANIPKDKIVGQSNHVLLLEADAYLEGNSDAFLIKANGNGHDGKMATIEFNADINTTKRLGRSLADLNITADDRAVDVRRDMVAKLLVHGNARELDDPTPVTRTGAVMYAQGATPESIDRGVYIYLNNYTDPLAQHIRERLNGDGDTTDEQRAAYASTMFCFCGSQTVSPDTPDCKNAMHIAQAANFDGVAAAGFGTSSEMHYLLENNAYQGDFLLMPVEQQHEQEANAFSLLPAALSDQNEGRVVSAHNIQELKDNLDNRILNSINTNAHLGNTTMASLLEATQRKGGPSVTDKPVDLLRGTGPGMNDRDAQLLEENNWRSNEAGRKEIRQLNKVMIPVLEAMFTGAPEATIRLKTSEPARTVNVENVIDGLSHPATLRDLTGVNITNQVARDLSDKFAEDLKSLVDLPNGELRQQMVDTYRRGEYADRTFTLGY